MTSTVRRANPQPAESKEKKPGTARRRALTAKETEEHLKKCRRLVAEDNRQRLRKSGITPEQMRKMGISKKDIDFGRVEIR